MAVANAPWPASALRWRAASTGVAMPMGADKRVTPERANQIVDKAAQEANDVIAATQADPMKKPKQLKAEVKKEVAKLVESGDPGQVVQYIKGHKKEFISGVYMSWFMKEIRAQLGGTDSGAAQAKKEPAANEKKAAAASATSKSAACAAPDAAASSAKAGVKERGSKAGGDAEPARKKRKAEQVEEKPDDADADASTSAGGPAAVTTAP